MAAGMLSGLFAPKYDDMQQDRRDEESRLQRVATMDPFQQAGYAGLQGARMAGRGLGTAVAGAMGADARPPAEKNMDAVTEAKRQVSELGFDPEDPKSIDEFYKRVIQILQKQGLAAEALAVAREWQTQKRADLRAGNEDKRLQLQNDELARKRERDAANTATARERNRILEQRGALKPETIQLLAEYDGVDPLDANGKFKQDAIVARLNAISAPKGVKFVNAGNRIVMTDSQGNELRTIEVGARPMNEKDEAKAADKDRNLGSAYASAKADYQKQYDAAVALHNHPGLSGITGRIGRLVGEEKEGQLTTAGHLATTAASDTSRAALALWKQVTGTTFLAGLAQLKAASPTGTTGLGAVSNAEGSKVQAAAAALSREQSDADLRKQLAIYIQTLVDSAGRLDAAATGEKVQAIPLRTKPLAGAPAQAAQPPAQPPSAAPAAPSDRVRVKMPDGQVGTIPRANLETAKAKGAVEVK